MKYPLRARRSVFVTRAAVSILLSTLLVGCRNRCAELDARICRDLGAECVHWSRRIGDDALTCDIVLSDRGYYDNALADARRNAACLASRPSSSNP
jgi:hypothetical protein